MTIKSTQTTGGDPVDGVDPGGTRPTSKVRRDKAAGEIEHKVTSGDRNSGTHSGVTENLDPAKQKKD